MQEEGEQVEEAAHNGQLTGSLSIAGQLVVPDMGRVDVCDCFPEDNSEAGKIHVHI